MILCSIILCSIIWCSIILFSIILCSIVLCSIILCSIVLCSIILFSIILCSIVLCSIILFSIILCSIILCSIIWCYIILFSIILCSIVLCSIILCSIILCSSKIVPLWDNMWKILYNGSGHRGQYGACALNAGYLRLQIHTLTICNTYFFSTAKMVVGTRLNIMLYVHCLSRWCSEYHDPTPNSLTFVPILR